MLIKPYAKYPGHEYAKLATSEKWCANWPSEWSSPWKGPWKYPYAGLVDPEPRNAHRRLTLGEVIVIRKDSDNVIFLFNKLTQEIYLIDKEAYDIITKLKEHNICDIGIKNELVYNILFKEYCEQ